MGCEHGLREERLPGVLHAGEQRGCRGCSMQTSNSQCRGGHVHAVHSGLRSEAPRSGAQRGAARTPRRPRGWSRPPGAARSRTRPGPRAAAPGARPRCPSPNSAPAGASRVRRPARGLSRQYVSGPCHARCRGQAPLSSNTHNPTPTILPSGVTARGRSARRCLLCLSGQTRCVRDAGVGLGYGPDLGRDAHGLLQLAAVRVEVPVHARHLAAAGLGVGDRDALHAGQIHLSSAALIEASATRLLLRSGADLVERAEHTRTACEEDSARTSVEPYLQTWWPQLEQARRGCPAQEGARRARAPTAPSRAPSRR
jgi:hypothetical protein